MRPLLIPMFAGLALLAPGTAAWAQATLVKAMPAANATASNVKTLSLSFSDRLVEAQSGVEIVMTGMPGMANHAPMKVSGFKTALAPDGKSLTLILPRALPAGTYRLSWHGVGSDGRRSEGSYGFSVK